MNIVSGRHTKINKRKLIRTFMIFASYKLSGNFLVKTYRALLHQRVIYAIG